MKQELLEEKIYALADSEVAKNLQLSVKHDCMGWRMYRGEKVIVRGGAQNVYEQYYPRFSQSYSVMMKMIEDLK